VGLISAPNRLHEAPEVDQVWEITQRPRTMRPPPVALLTEITCAQDNNRLDTRRAT